MSQYSSKDVGFVLLDGYNVLGTLTTLQDSVEVILQETTVLGASWATFASLGISKGALSQGGYYDDAAGSINAALVAQQGNSRVFVYTVESNTVGVHFIGYGGALEAKYERVLALEKLHVANAVYNPSGAIEIGQLLKKYEAVVAAGNTQSASVDNGADTRQTVYPITGNSVAAASVVTCPVPHNLVNSDVVVITGSGSTPSIDGKQTVTVLSPLTFSVPVTVTVLGSSGTFVKAKTTNGGAGYLSCSNLTLGGYTNLAVRVQHSADNSVWVDLVTFTVVTSAPNAQRVAVAGTVNQYLSAIWAFTGAGSGPSATFMVGFSRA